MEGIKRFILNLLLGVGALIVNLWGPQLPPDVVEALGPDAINTVVNAAWVIYAWVAVLANFIMGFFIKKPALFCFWSKDKKIQYLSQSLQAAKAG